MTDQFTIQSIEEHLFKAWPALTTHYYDGWILRFAQGHTRRANSVNPMYKSSLDVIEKIAYCEDMYREHGLPIYFRLTPQLFPENLGELLEQQHYKKSTSISVYGFDISQLAPQPDTPQTVIHTDFSELWFKHYIKLNNQPDEQVPIIRQMLEKTFISQYYAAIRQDDDIAAIGYGAFDGHYLALFQIATHPHYRRQGLGSKLITDMMHFAQSKGASLAYLQVVPENTAALQLYDKMGFHEMYRYWYYSNGG